MTPRSFISLASRPPWSWLETDAEPSALLLLGEVLFPTSSSKSPHPGSGISHLTLGLQNWGSVLPGSNSFDELQFRAQHLIDLRQAHTQRIIEKMGVAMGRLHLRVAEQPSNHR